MKKNNSVNVVIVGGDHHNTLSLIRCFGKKKISFKVLIHTDLKPENLMVIRSKYAKNFELVSQNEIAVLNSLLKNKLNDKQVIVPGSDLAEYVIDKNYEILNEFYYIPGFKNNHGMVIKMMDKFQQKEWADKNDIPMAKSWHIIKDNNSFVLPSNIKFPCIIKPNISVMGSKGDIKICKNISKLNECLETTFKEYDDIIIQQYLIKKFEILAMGLISDAGCIGGVERKIRESIPGGGGSTSLGKFIDEKNILDKVNNVLKVLYADGYRGLYDVEFFECSDGIYLNEINFRHSGSGYALIGAGINTPYLYYLDIIGKLDDKNLNVKKVKGYFFSEIGEIYLLMKYKTINIFQFLIDFMKSKSHAVYEISDLGPFKFILKKYLKIFIYKKIKRKKK